MFINDSYPRATTANGELQTATDWSVEPTVIRKGASIGSGAAILSNLVIGERAIIGAGAVVTHDVPAGAIVAGNPARILRTIRLPKKESSMSSGSAPALASVGDGLHENPRRFTHRPTPDQAKPVRVGVIGYGYWGPNIVRNFQGLEHCRAGVDLRQESRCAAARQPHLPWRAGDDGLRRHPDIARYRCRRGHHAGVDPLRTGENGAAERQACLRRETVHVNVGTGRRAHRARRQKDLKIMVDHTFLFSGAVRKIRELVDKGTLGSLYYFDSTRVNLGLFQHDVSVVWDLAPHDLSIMDYLINESPEAVVATGANHLNGHADVAFITVYFPRNIVAHINVNWLSPVKVRTTLIGGKDKMLVWNDLEADEKIKVYDKGVEIRNGQNVYDLLVSYRSGDVWSPKVEQTEALKVELDYFVDCIRNDREPSNNGAAGLRVVRLLEAAEQSLKDKGRLIHL